MNLFFLSCCFATIVITQAPHLLVTQPSGEMVDREAKIVVEHLVPFQEIELRAETKDKNGEVWFSHATFQSNGQGVVDVSSSQPLSHSSYEGIDGMGLFWSMVPSSGKSSESFKCKDDLFPVEFKLYVDGHLTNHKTIIRYLKAPDVQRIDVRENGLVGTLFVPKSNHPLPVIITLTGSNGGLSESRAKLLASNGFAAFALAYFGVEGLPSNLQNIELEYFEKACAWLKDQPQIDSSHIGLYGVSRGAELSLILGSLFPTSVQAIVAVAPSSVVYGEPSNPHVNTWIYQGKPIAPCAPVSQTKLSDGQGQTAENPVTVRQTFLDGMKDKQTFSAASIPVEKIRCPILLVSGGDDRLWPSELYAHQIIDSLMKVHSPITCRHVHYPHAGHGITIPNLPIPDPTYYHPVAHLWLSLGGTRASDADASADSWKKLVAFFRETLNTD